jgi:hypothetical protein
VSRRRTAALVLLGILTGSSMTALLFYLFAREQAVERPEIAGAMSGVDAGNLGEVGLSEEDRAAWDISGSCVFVGTVTGKDGSGIEGAVARIRVQGEAWAVPDPTLRATTDAEGRFELGGVRDDLVYQLWAFAPGRSTASQENVSCGMLIDFVLDDGAALDLAFLKPNGDPAENVSVVLAGASLWPAREAKTGPDGELTIVGLDPGEYVLWAHSAGLAYISDEPIVLQSGKETSMELELEIAGAALVTVLDSLGKPTETGATVVVGPSSTSLLYRATTVDEKGGAIIPSLPEGEYTAQALADRYVETEPLPIRPDDTIVFKMEIGATVAGVVRTEDGRPVSGASLVVDQGLGSSFVALPAGAGRSFRRRILNAARAGWPKLYRLEKSAFVSGPHNLPLPEVEADVSTAVGRAWRLTDDSGGFFLDGLPSGRVAVSAEHPDFVMQKTADLTLERASAVSDAVVLMRPGSTATVRTLDERGYPVAGAEIVAYDSNQEAISDTASGSDGVAALKGLPGSFRIVAAADGRVPAAARVDGKTGAASEIQIVLPLADRTLHGRLTDENGFGVADAVVIARSVTKGLVHVLTATTEDDGTFSIEEAGPGSYHITADAGERGRAQLGDARYDMELKLVLDTKGALEPEMVTPEDFAEAVGVDKPYEAPYAADNLGTTAPSFDADGQSSFNTRFGQADELAVTGPPSGKGGLPISVGGGPGRVVVTGVTPGTSVAVAGLSNGDRIVEIDGKRIKGPDDARKAISGLIGSVVMLKVESEGEIFTIVVQRERVRAN